MSDAVIDYHRNHGNTVSSGYIAGVSSHIFRCIGVHIHPILSYSCNCALSLCSILSTLPFCHSFTSTVTMVTQLVKVTLQWFQVVSELCHIFRCIDVHIYPILCYSCSPLDNLINSVTLHSLTFTVTMVKQLCGITALGAVACPFEVLG